MSLRDLLVELVVLIREAEDFQGVVLVVREVQLHRHVCHLRQRDDISGGASLILGKCMNVLCSYSKCACDSFLKNFWSYW